MYSCSNLVGNKQIWHNLVNDCLTGALSHAYIFAGTEGIGKASMAKEFIKLIIKADDIISTRIDEGDFLDLLYISKEEKSEIGIDSIRKLGEFMSLTPHECEYKFVIIDEADDLNRNASNALLKILEEPTANSFLILISHKPLSLLATIRSRARMIKFSPLTKGELRLVANIGELADLEELVAGSIGKAKLNEQVNFRLIYERLLDLIYNKDVTEFNQFSSDFLKDDLHWNVILQILEFIFLQLAKVNSNIIINDLDPRIKKIAQDKSLAKQFLDYDEFLKIIRQTEIFNLDKKQVLFQALHSF